MARLARVVIPGAAHHVTQRAPPGLLLFSGSEDYRAYRILLERNCAARAVAILAWCLVPDHIHLVLRPTTHDGLARAVGETHRLFARHRGLGASALWHGRFKSCPLEPALAPAAIAYVESNPARLALSSWPWVSIAADPAHATEDDAKAIRAATRTGRPAGSADFIARIEYETGRRLKRGKRGRKPKW